MDSLLLKNRTISDKKAYLYRSLEWQAFALLWVIPSSKGFALIGYRRLGQDYNEILNQRQLRTGVAHETFPRWCNERHLDNNAYHVNHRKRFLLREDHGLPKFHDR